MIACFEGRFQIAEELIKHNADVNKVNKLGNTALILACSHNCLQKTTIGSGLKKVVEILINSGASVDIVNNDGMNAISVAEEKGKGMEVVKILRDATK